MARLQTENKSSSREARREIAPEELRVGVNPDEAGQILNLKKNLDYSDVVTKYATRYLQMGWELVAVNLKGTAELDLDFSQPEPQWSQRLTHLGLGGTLVNVGVRTGGASNLIVLETKSSGESFPSILQGEWRSGCVAQAGMGWEQHYYVLPKGFPPPPSCYLDSHRLMVFGNEGLVLAPPSLEPRARESLRWLRPPWESPPSRPSPHLLQFLAENIPATDIPSAEPETPSIPGWEEIYAHVARHTNSQAVFQALLAPATGEKEYYLQVLQAALEAGISDMEILLGLLWHAPLGQARNRPQGHLELQDLIDAALNPPEALPEAPPEAMMLERLTTLMEELKSTFAALSPKQEQHMGPLQSSNVPVAAPNGGRALEKNGAAARMMPQGPERPSSLNFNGQPEALFWMSPENILVQRERYEAMLYELGKLGAWHEIQKVYKRENKTLKEKLESQQQKEILHLRSLCSQKKDKGWWR